MPSFMIPDMSLGARTLKPAALPSQPNESLIGGLECLEAVVAAGAPVGTREIARRLDMNHTRVNRLIKTLAHLGLLERTDAGKYRPGPGIHVLAALSLQGSTLLRAGLQHAKPWWEEGFVVTVGVLWKDSVCHLLHARPDRPFDQSIGAHELSPASWSAAGLVLLAARCVRETRSLDLPSRPEWLDPDEPLEQTLAFVRAHGHALRRYKDSRVSLGVPLGDPAIAGLAVSRIGLKPPAIAATVSRLHETAAAIARDASAT